MKKLMMTALCFAMALNMVACSEDETSEEETADLAIVNVMDYAASGIAEAIYVSEASGSGKAIIPGMLPFVTLNPKRVYVAGSFNGDESGLADGVSIVSLKAGRFQATYQAQSDNDGDCTGEGSVATPCSGDGFETNISGVITAQYTVEAEKHMSYISAVLRMIPMVMLTM